MKLIPTRDLTREKAEKLAVNMYITKFHGDRYGVISTVSDSKITSVDCYGDRLVFGSRLVESTHEVGRDGRVLNVIAVTPIDFRDDPERYMRQWTRLAEYAVGDRVDKE